MRSWTALPLTVILVAAGSASAVTPARLASSIDAVVAASGGRAHVARHRVTGAASLLQAPAGTLPVAGETPAARAADALRRYGAAFGVADVAVETDLVGSRPERLGGTVVAFGQRWHGLPVLGAELRVRLDRTGELTSVNGVFVPDIAIADHGRRITLAEARAVARAAVAHAHGVAMDELAVSDHGEAVYRRALVHPRAAGGDAVVRQLEVRLGDRLAELVLVSTADGRVLERIPLIYDITRKIHLHNIPNPIWDEGDPLPFSGISPDDDAEVNSIIDATGGAYQLFANLSGGTFLSWNGTDGRMQAVHDTTQLACPNAQWTGSHTRFCRGTGVTDVVAHEWTHAYTQSTHGLIYAYQQGALNESYSDIFGEIVQLLADPDPTPPAVLRTFDTCSAFADLGGPRTIVLEPPELAGELQAGGADYNPLPPWTVEATAELADDGDGFTSDGCQPLVGFTPGHIAVLDLGACRFQAPVEAAAAAGAVGAVIVNRLNNNVTQMPGDGSRLDIPAVMIGKDDGARLKAALDSGVTLRLVSVDEGSVRWLVGETSPAFGGAIRDMWAPECLGDPGAVTSSSYWCADGDNGGVHVNSAIPNRAFALLADGASTPAGEIRGIGLTRAAHIYWRAMSVYQIPLTDFADHADLLQLACSDLIGAPLTDLATGAVSGDVISADDCAQLPLAARAVALRAQPTQCGFQPVLAAPAPAVRSDLTLLEETFDSAPGPGWELTWTGVGANAQRRDWEWTDDLPQGGDGGAMYAADLPYSAGCNGRTVGAIGLTSPAVTLPTTAGVMLTFDHYVAAEQNQDGGNVKLSVNGGPFELIPAAAFRFNPYNLTLTAAADNDNPLAGEPAWSGYDGGSFEGSWGQSQVDLSGLTQPGDTIRVRFEFGNDLCIGGVGWYVDTVRLLATSPVRNGGARIGG